MRTSNAQGFFEELGWLSAISGVVESIELRHPSRRLVHDTGTVAIYAAMRKQ